MFAAWRTTPMRSWVRQSLSSVLTCAHECVGTGKFPNLGSHPSSAGNDLLWCLMFCCLGTGKFPVAGSPPSCAGNDLLWCLSWLGFSAFDALQAGELF